MPIPTLALALTLIAAVAAAQSTQPTTQPTTQRVSKSELGLGETLALGGKLDVAGVSLELRTDGNLVVDVGAFSHLWEAKSGGRGVASAELRTDGNFVLVDGSGAVIWETETAGKGATQLQVVQGGFELRGHGGAVWSSSQSGGKLHPASGGTARTPDQLWIVCAACHGPKAEGMKTVDGPALAGLESWYLEKSIQDFRNGIRGTHEKDALGKQCAPMTKTLTTDEQVEALAKWLSEKELTKVKPTLTGGDAARGKTKYAVCIACHGMDGQGMAALKSGKLVGQHDWYIERQLLNFKAGIRGTNPKDIQGLQMRPMAMTLVTEQDVKDVIAYIMTLNK